MRRLLSAIAALLIAASCGTASGTPAAGTASPGSPSTTPSPPGCDLQLGVAGRIAPPNPHTTAEDWTGMYESLHETGPLLGVYTNWSDSPDEAGQVPGVIATAFGLAPTYGFTPLVALSFARDAAEGGVESTVAWDDPAQKALAVQAAVAVAGQFEPPFLALGVEVNSLYESDPAAFDGYVAAYAEMYDAIKAASPATLVFPVFQLEAMKGAGYLTGKSAGRQPQWALLEKFAGRMDLAAFTTYPFFDFPSPAGMPDDYYAEIATHTSAPMAFTEIGWPSAPLSTAPASEYGGSPEEQAAFVGRFAELTGDLDVRAALWSFPNDLGSGLGYTAFESVSLRANDGAGKPALAEWRALAQAPCGSAS